MKKSLVVLVAVLAGSSASMVACSGNESPVTKEYVQTHHPMINGSKDAKPEHKAVVALITTKTGEAFCTGTLIHPEWILTAGHCVAKEGGSTLDPNFKKTSSIAIGAGENQFSSKYAISQVYLHEEYGDRYIGSGYSKYTLDGDIALIKLTQAVPASVAQPILPHPKWLAINDTDLPMDMEFSGFGYTESGDIGTKLAFSGPVKSVCRVSDSCVVGKGYCKKDTLQIKGCHPADYIGSYCAEPVNESDTVYAPCGSFYYLQAEGGPCNGDSGGPMFDTLGGREYVNGITSYGDTVCAFYGISTSVQDYYDWIISKAPEVAGQYTEICGNGLDDDGDGKIDSNDEDCGGSTTPTAPTDPSKEICGDGIDNDGDGYIDCKDYDCTYDAACAEICNDGIDNDGDGFVDCKDFYCKNDPACNGSSPAPVEICNDGIDNDGNGLIDCNDTACMYDNNCTAAPSDDPYICSSELCELDDGTERPCGEVCVEYYGANYDAWCDNEGRVECLKNDNESGNDNTGNDNTGTWSICTTSTCTLPGGETMTCGIACANRYGANYIAWCDNLGNVECSMTKPSEPAVPAIDAYQDCSNETCRLSDGSSIECGVACNTLVGAGTKAWCDEVGNVLCDSQNPNATTGNTNRLDLDGDVPAEICNDHIDNNFDGLIDCEDPECAKSLSCLMAQINNANQTDNAGNTTPGSQTNNTDSANPNNQMPAAAPATDNGNSDSCSAAPLTGANHPAPLAAGLFGLFGLLGLSIRRRSTQK